MLADIPTRVKSILSAYSPDDPALTADQLRAYWLEFEPKSIAGIKAEQRALQETVGIPVPVLRAIGKEIAKVVRKQVDAYLPLACLLWDDYGREGRVVTVYLLGALELAAPERVVPVILELCRSCLTWEDADQLAMRALEPIVRKQPDQWLPALEPWLVDESKWVRRAAVTVIGRLTMKHAGYTAHCLELSARLLLDDEMDVKRATSFAIRISARGDLAAVRTFLLAQVPPSDLAATWVLCDVIRSMTKAFLPEFAALLPRYQEWLADPGLSAKDRRSIESAYNLLRKVT